MIKKYDVQRYRELFEEMSVLAIRNDWGDPFSYARSREILMAGVLGHKIASTLSGADGIDSEGECEYKSTIAKNINATYSGISVKENWEKQIEYLQKEKICKYKNHYHSRFKDGKIIEIWKLVGDDVFDIIRPKLKKQFFKMFGSSKILADPRLRACINAKEIRSHGELIYKINENIC